VQAEASERAAEAKQCRGKVSGQNNTDVELVLIEVQPPKGTEADREEERKGEVTWQVCCQC